MGDEKIILAIETALKTPGVSILKNEYEIDFWRGGTDVSGSESLLPAVLELLDKNKIPLKEINRVAVSVGPGSFTGVRIGLATAKGIGTGGNFEICGINTLEAIARAAESKGHVKSILPAGRDKYFVQDFDFSQTNNTSELTPPTLQTLNDVLHETQSNSNITIISDAFINQMLSQYKLSSKLSIQPENMARYIGLCALETRTREFGRGEGLKALYVRQADFERLPKK